MIPGEQRLGRLGERLGVVVAWHPLNLSPNLPPNLRFEGSRRD
jgi:hypothetical protein